MKCQYCGRDPRVCHVMPCLEADRDLRTPQGAARWFRACGFQALAFRRAGRWAVQVLVPKAVQ